MGMALACGLQVFVQGGIAPAELGAVHLRATTDDAEVTDVPTKPCDGIALSRLRTEWAHEPLGIEVGAGTPPPRFSWALIYAGKEALAPTRTRGFGQLAYRLVVKAGPESSAAAMWDSGWVEGNTTVSVKYGGDMGALPAGQKLVWQVRSRVGVPKSTRGQHGGDSAGVSQVEASGLFTTDSGPWQAKWISRGDKAPTTDCDYYQNNPIPTFRRKFSLPHGEDAAAKGGVALAIVRVSYLGFGTLYIDGVEVDPSSRLNQAQTDYSKRVLYSTYDVTGHFSAATGRAGGDHDITVEVGNGWWSPLPLRFWGALNLRSALAVGYEPQFILELDVRYGNGDVTRVLTGPDWEAGSGDVVRNNVYLGEVIDARLRAGMGGDAAWRNATIASATPGGALKRMAIPPVRVAREVRPVAFYPDPTDPTRARYIVDFGENFSAMLVMSNATGPAGGVVTVRYGEVLRLEDGGLNVMTSVAGQIKSPGTGGPCAPDIAWQGDTFILSGGPSDSFEPRYTWHGFRYAEVNASALSAAPTAGMFVARVVHADLDPIGHVATSSEVLNSIHGVYRRTILSNVMGVQSDCPHRERFGYGGDLYATAETQLMHFDMSAYYEKLLDDYTDAVRPNGGFTETAPYVGIHDSGFGDAGPVDWGSVQPILSSYLLRYHGNVRAAENGGLERSVAYLGLLEANMPIVRAGLGDWMTLESRATTSMTGLVFLYVDLMAVSEVAGHLGNTTAQAHYAAKAHALGAAINSEFLDPSTGSYRDGTAWNSTQVGQAVMLYFDLVPASAKTAAIDILLSNLASHGNHLQVGMFGVKWLLFALSGVGQHSVAEEVVLQTSFPGFGYMLQSNASTFWESWDYSDNTFSHNHPMFGSVAQWIMSAVGGVAVADGAVASDRFTIAPNPSSSLCWANASYSSLRGPVVSEWRVKDGLLLLRAVVPFNARAVIQLPWPTDVGGGVTVRDVLAGADINVTSRNVVCRPAPGLHAAPGLCGASSVVVGVALHVGGGAYELTIPSDIKTC